jgi:hypothetical protein
MIAEGRKLELYFHFIPLMTLYQSNMVEWLIFLAEQWKESAWLKVKDKI